MHCSRPQEPSVQHVRSRRSRSTRLIALSLLGASVLFAGCGDEGAHLPTGMSQSAALGADSGIGVHAIDSVLGGDPGPSTTVGVGSMLEDPVLAGYDGVNSLDSMKFRQ